MSSSVPTLGYWDCRGIAQPIRNLLHYVGAAFNDKVYKFGPGVSRPKTQSDADRIRKEWFDEKYNLGLEFPKLPYYFEGDLKLTQSTTILRYLARKHGLIAKTDPELARQELAEQQLQDMRSDLIKIIYNFYEFDDKKEGYINDKLVPQLEAFSKFLGSNEWITSELSYTDFMAYDILDQLRLFSPDQFEKFPNLCEYLNRFENLKPIKEFFNSPDYKSWPTWTPIAKWGFFK